MRYLSAALFGALLCAVLWGRWEAHRAEGWRDYAHGLKTASQTAAAQTKAMREAEAKQYQERAREVQSRYIASRDIARAITDAYIHAYRVQPSGGQCSTSGVGEADPASVREDVPATAVMVSDDDVRRAAEWQAYGIAMHDWALSVGQ